MGNDETVHTIPIMTIPAGHTVPRVQLSLRRPISYDLAGKPDETVYWTPRRCICCGALENEVIHD